MSELWQTILQWSIGSVLMLVFGALVLKARMRDLAVNFSSEMRMPIYMLIVGVVDVVLFVGIAVLSNLFPNETVTPVTTVAFLFFASLGGYLIYLYFVQRHRIEDSHIVFTSMFGSQTTIAWNEMAKITYNAGLQWFVVETKSGKRYHFSEIMRGIKQFSWTVLQKVGSAKISEKAIGPLERFKVGRLE